MLLLLSLMGLPKWIMAMIMRLKRIILLGFCHRLKWIIIKLEWIFLLFVTLFIKIYLSNFFRRILRLCFRCFSRFMSWWWRSLPLILHLFFIILITLLSIQICILIKPCVKTFLIVLSIRIQIKSL